MNWFIYAFACAIFLSASSLIEKRALQKVHTIDFSVSSAILNFFFSIPFLFFVDTEGINGITLLFIFVTALLSATAFFLVVKGLRHLELSLVSPILSLSPGVTSLVALFALGEKLNVMQLLGIGCMIVGSYILATKHEEKDLLMPFKTFFRSPYIHFVLLSLLFYSVAAVFDRVILFSFKTTVPIYMFFSQFFITLLFIPVADMFDGGFNGIKRAFRLGGINVVFSSLFSTASRFFEMQSIQLASIGLVSAIKRSSAFFTTIIGGEMFHERNLKRKIISSIIIFAGVLLIVI